ncbi:hypothetical protein EJC51_02295 [Streptomyces aquilus]|uniref:Uncharacterized protein n=1 Tax=Streptomyces aquilus TaxID=2548456 RepID=A0A3Q9BV00_9ACTN|nr:hypothetical protein [Streptomyces aquilus]AZP15063.1 hypothetical protein EJC51_02295 [Streptomyces aquilus]
MAEPSSHLHGETAETHVTRSPRGRHALPRASALTRLRLPLGKALALTALPTALVLGSQRPPTVDTSATTAQSVPEEAAESGVDCDRTDAPSKPTVTPTPSAAPATPSAAPSEQPVKPTEHTAETPLTPDPPPSPGTPSATPTLTGLAGLLDPLFGGDTEQQSPAPATPASPTSAAPTPIPKATQSTTLPAAPSPSRRTTSPAAPSTSQRTTSASPLPHPAQSPQGTDRTCDISDLAAPRDKSAGRFAAESWNMKGSHLELRDVVFGGVVTVDTAAGPKRVLKFSAAGVTIRDLKMAVPVSPQIQHIDGAPGSTSTLQGDRITMYVESLTGTLSGAEGIPLPPVLRLHLTPDTVPEWLYDTVGKLDLKLQLALDDADIDQAGQTGGKLIIPGIHGYGTIETSGTTP